MSEFKRRFCFMGGYSYLWLLLIVLIISCIYIIGLYNKVVRLQNIIPENRSNIEILRKKKEYLISKMIEIVNSYGLHESSIATTVSGDMSGKSSQGGFGPAIVQRLANLRMAFPQLQADHLYSQLLSELSEVESEIVQRREEYNTSVRGHNTLILQFPANIILAPFRFQTVPFLAITDLNS